MGLRQRTGYTKEKIRPDSAWISSVIGNARTEGIPLFIKGNVDWHEKMQEFPGW